MAISERALGTPKTRADRVRSRRARVSRNVNPPKPVTKGKSRRARKPRRRIDLALAPEQGLEMRLPALPIFRVGVRPVSALCLAAVMLMTRSALSGTAFQVQEVSISGARLLSEVQVRSVADVMATNVFLIDPAEVEGLLEAYPEIEQAQVQVRWPSQVEIELSERRPVVIWDDGGRSWWLSREGVALIRRETEIGLVRVVSPEPVLNISREAEEAAVDPQVLSAAVELSAQFPKAFFFTFDTQHGLGFQDPRGWQAYFGHQGDMDQKVRVYQAIADRLDPQGPTIEYVDVTDPTMPYYRITR